MSEGGGGVSDVWTLSRWDARFLALADHLAQWSKDPSTRVGCVIVDDQRRIVGTGYNGFPRGVVDDPARYEDKTVKYEMIVHAEANAILNATSSLRDCTLYCTKSPCPICVQMIIQQGIARVISAPPSTEGVWAERSIVARAMLLEAGVVVFEVDAYEVGP